MVAASTTDLLSLKDHVVICGWSPTALRVLEGLAGIDAAMGHAVALVNHADPSEMADLRLRFPRLNIHHVFGPYHLESTLKEANCGAASAAIVVADTTAGPDADSRTILCTLTIENMGGETKTCAELIDREQEPNLKRAGVDEVIIRGEHSGFFLSSGALSPGISKAARKLVTFGSGSELRRVAIPEPFINHSFGKLQEHVRQSGALLIGIIRESEVITAAEVFGSGQDWIDTFIKASFEAAGEDVLDRDKDPIKVYINPNDDFVVEFKDSAVIIGGTRDG